MIDRLAIATSGYRSIERRNFSASVDGYYVNKIIIVVPVEPQRPLERTSYKTGAGGGIGVSFKEDHTETYIREEEELFLFIKIFLDTCHL